LHAKKTHTGSGLDELLGCKGGIKPVVVELGWAHEILGQCAASMENRGFEADMSLVVVAVLGDYIEGVSGGVGYWGLLGAIGNVQNIWAGTGNVLPMSMHT